MAQINIFLGSSFKLMRIRRLVGDKIRQLNDKWLNNGVRIRLLIWEDFTIGYSGKRKQQEYIDEMVLKSEICFFMFSDRVGKYTKMELEAKLEQDKNAVNCYRLPDTKRTTSYNNDVGDELESLGVDFVDMPNGKMICESIASAVESYIKNNVSSVSHSITMEDKYFYTTIPDDIPQVQQSIGTEFREFNDRCMDLLGVHCILHPRQQKDLMNDTDHYIPILKEKVSDVDIDEIRCGIRLASDPNSRMERMTVFDLGNFYHANGEVESMLDESGIYTDKISTMDSLKWKLLGWVGESRKRMLGKGDICVAEGNITVNHKPIVPISALNSAAELSTISEKKRHVDIQRDRAIADNDDAKAQKLVFESVLLEKKLTNIILSEQNKWALNAHVTTDAEKALINRLLELEKELLTPKSIDAQLGILNECERLSRRLVEKGRMTPYGLLYAQLQLVALFDTCITKNGVLINEENELYARITSDSDNLGLREPMVEVMRMNLGNKFSREENYAQARLHYRTAVENLNSMRDDSIAVARCLSIVLMHWVNMERKCGTYEDYINVLSEFKDHIGALDLSNKVYVVDQCLLATAELAGIDIEDDSKLEIVYAAEDLFREAVELGAVDLSSGEFMDLFVFMPNMIARYYIDHLRQFDDAMIEGARTKTEYFLRSALEQCQNLKTIDYQAALFYEGELLHQTAFFYSLDFRQWQASLEMYAQCLEIRRRSYELTGNRVAESCIAQTLVNYGGFELSILEKIGNSHFDGIVDLDPLSKAREAIEIYGRHIIKGNENSELVYYEALQLRGTVLYYYCMQNPKAIVIYNQSMEDLIKCWRWNKEHITNQYRRMFFDYSGRILLERNLINEDEYYSVKAMLKIDN